MKEDTTRILSAICGATDALWEPLRTPADISTGCAVQERQVRYRGGHGVPWSSRMAGAGDAADRQAIHRLLVDLGLGDYVVTSNPSGGRTTGVTLTPAGYDFARGMADMATAADGYPMLVELHRLADHPDVVDYLGNAWLPETALGGCKWGDADQKEKLAEVQEQLLPWLVAGVVTSRCSIQGHCWYQIPDTLPAEPARNAIDPIDGAYDVYLAARRAERAVLRRQKSTSADIGIVPMPICPERRGQ